jgi:hypothetical protein
VLAGMVAPQVFQNFIRSVSALKKKDENFLPLGSNVSIPQEALQGSLLERLGYNIFLRYLALR